LRRVRGSSVCWNHTAARGREAEPGDGRTDPTGELQVDVGDRRHGGGLQAQFDPVGPNVYPQVCVGIGARRRYRARADPQGVLERGHRDARGQGAQQVPPAELLDSGGGCGPGHRAARHLPRVATGTDNALSNPEVSKARHIRTRCRASSPTSLHRPDSGNAVLRAERHFDQVRRSAADSRARPVAAAAVLAGSRSCAQL
jgi:hypothetical protein